MSSNKQVVNGNNPAQTLQSGKNNVIRIDKGQHLRIQELSNGANVDASNVIATRQGRDLKLRYADGTILIVEDFFVTCSGDACSVTLPGENGGFQLDGDAEVGAATAEGGELVYAHGDEATLMALANGDPALAGMLRDGDDHGSTLTWLPQDDDTIAGMFSGNGIAAMAGIVALGGIGAAALSDGNDGRPATPPEAVNVVTGVIVAGPAVKDNNLQVIVYDASGNELGRSDVDDSGRYTVDVGNYTGVIIAKLFNPDDAPDYIDEATGEAVNLTTELFATSFAPAGGTITININPLTTVAARRAGLNPDGTLPEGSTLTADTVTNANETVAKAFGLEDLTGSDIVTTVVDTDGDGQADSNENYNPEDGVSNAERYGAVLAALSGMDKNNGESGDDASQQTIDDILEGFDDNGTLTPDVIDKVVEGAHTTDPEDDLGLIDTTSDATEIVSNSITINDVTIDNIINSLEQTYVVTGTTEEGAAVTLQIGGTIRTAIVTGTTWSYALTPEDINAMNQGAETLLATATLSGAEPSTASRGVFVDTELPTISISTVASDDSINAAEKSAGVTVSGTSNAENGQTVTVNWGGTLKSATVTNGTWSVNFASAEVPADGNSTISATVTDRAGNAGSTNKAVTIDSALPTATVAVSDSTIGVGETATVTVTFSDAPTDFDISDLVADNGTLSNGSFDASGKIFTATFTPASNIEDTTNVVTLGAGWNDAGGNAPAQAVTSANYVVDTIRPTIAISSSDDTLKTGETATITFTLSEASTDFTLADVSVTGGTLSNLTGSGTTYTATFTPAANTTAASISVASNRFSDAAGNFNSDGADSNNSIAPGIDTVLPTATVTISRTTMKAGETATVTVTFSEVPSEFALADLVAENGTLSNGSFDITGKIFTATFTPTSNVEDTTNVVTLGTAWSDVAGNAPASSSASGNYSLDTRPPAAPGITLGEDSGFLDDFPATYGEDDTHYGEDNITNHGTITISGIESGASWQYSINGGEDWITGEETEINLQPGDYTGEDAILVRQTDTAGNTSTTRSFEVVVDTSNPDNPTLALGEDTGMLGENDTEYGEDFTTNNDTINVSGLETNARWEYSLNGGEDWISGEGDSFTIGEDGDYTGEDAILVRQIDLAGNIGEETGIELTLDTVDPGSITLTLGEDTGMLGENDTEYGEDAVTKNNIININLDDLEEGARWQYSLDGGTTWLLGEGDSFNVGEDGDYTGEDAILVRQIDVAGNIGEETSIELTLDTVAPDAITLTLGEDTGMLGENDTEYGEDAVTSNGTINIDLDDLEEGARWQYSLDGGTTWLLGEGDSLTVGEDGDYTGEDAILVRQVDVAGNTGEDTSIELTLDTVDPGSITLTLGEDTGMLGENDTEYGEDAVTSNGTINIDLDDLEEGARWQYSLDGGTTWLLGEGDSFNVGEDGDYTGEDAILVRQIDVAGNIGEETSIELTLDTQDPEALTLTLGEDTGEDDGITENGLFIVSGLETGARWEYSYNGGENWHVGEDTYGEEDGSFTLDDDTYAINDIRVRQIDVAGNVSIETSNDGEEGREGEVTVESPEPGFMLSTVVGEDNGFVIHGAGEDALSGYSVSNAGDVNGDGYDDVIVGSPAGINNNNPSAQYGNAYLVFGKANNTPVDLANLGVNGITLTLSEGSIGSNLGFSVSAAGDVNGDGFADLIVGSPGGDESYVVFGSSNIEGIDFSSNGYDGFEISGIDTGGSSVSSAGDVNGDGLDDLLIGAPEGAIDGTSYVVFGKTDTTAVDLNSLGAGGFAIVQDMPMPYSLGLGYSVSSAGDFNGDGLADLIVSSNSDYYVSSHYLVYGKANSTTVTIMYGSISSTDGIRIDNNNMSMSSSSPSVSAAGDVNGDGYADLILGFSAGDMSMAGTSYVVFGSANTGFNIDLSGTSVDPNGFAIIGESGSQSGYSVSSAGDINGDGLTDLLIGAPGAGGGNGKSYVVYGKTDTTAVDLSQIANGTDVISGFAIVNDTGIDTQIGHSVSAAGDVNGDGLADLIVSGYNSTDNDSDTYVIFGSTTDNGFVNGTTVDYLGEDGNDTHAASAAGETLVGGAGEDTLTANGATVMYGGIGNDTFVLDADMISALQTEALSGDIFARVDGGAGIDTLVLSGATSATLINLTEIANQAASNPDGGSRLQSIEVIDITDGNSNNITLSLQDVLDMSSANAFTVDGRHQLVVTGDAFDYINFSDSANWSYDHTNSISYATQTYQTYYAWEHNSGLATVYTNQQIG